MKGKRPPPRLLLDEPIGSRQELTLTGVQARYLNRVLRLRAAAPVIVFDGHGAEYLARIVRYQRDSAVIELGEILPALSPSTLRILLLQGISKGERMDFAVQKSTELGVAEIFPVYTQFSVVKLDAERAKRRAGHWQRVAGKACEQSGRHFPPTVHFPQSLHQCIGELPGSAARLAFDPRGASCLDFQDRPPATVAALVGPEGGFSQAELDDLGTGGFQLLSLGDQVLRTETAAVAVCALLQARWGDLKVLNGAAV